MSDINLSNLQVPPTTTMSMHMDAVNPHPQYVRIDELSTATNVKVAVRHLQDVDDSIPTNNTILVYKGAKYSPVTMDEFRGILNIPYATTEEAGVIEVATNSDLGTLNNVAVTPALMEGYVADYVNIALNNFNIPPATDITIGGVTLNQISTITSNIVRASAYILPDATPEVKGGVYIATIPECVAGVDTSRAVTPAGLHTAITSAMASTSEYVLPVATTSTLGGVKVIETDFPDGKSKIAELITSIQSINWPEGATSNPDQIVSYVPQIQYNQFVNVRIQNSDVDHTPTSFHYYKTYPDSIASDAAAEELRAMRYPGNYLVYDVYSNGVLSGRQSYNPANVDHNHTIVQINKGGVAYDINTYGTVVVRQEGNIKRLVVGPDCFTVIEGIAHGVNVSAPAGDKWGAGAVVWVANHGHVEYAMVEGKGQLICAHDNTDAIVENVTVCNSISNYAGLQISAKGKGYNITLVNSASAYIYGYAKDVTVHSGCCLWARTSARIDNLILYNGAEVKVNPGVKITGCIVYPGAVVTGDVANAEIDFNTCHEPDRDVEPITKTVHYYTTAQDYFEFKGTEFINFREFTGTKFETNKEYYVYNNNVYTKTTDASPLVAFTGNTFAANTTYYENCYYEYIGSTLNNNIHYEYDSDNDTYVLTEDTTPSRYIVFTGTTFEPNVIYYEKIGNDDNAYYTETKDNVKDPTKTYYKKNKTYYVLGYTKTKDATPIANKAYYTKNKTYYTSVTYYVKNDNDEYVPTADITPADTSVYYTKEDTLKGSDDDYYFTNSKYWINNAAHYRHNVPNVALLYGADTVASTVKISGDVLIKNAGTYERNYITILHAHTPPRCFVRSDMEKISALRTLNTNTAEGIAEYNALSKGAVVCYPANILKIGTPNVYGAIRYEIAPDFNQDAYHEQWVSAIDGTKPTDPEIDPVVRRYVVTSCEFSAGTTAVKNVTIGDYGVFATSAYCLPFYKQIQSKMFDELNTSNRKVVWKIAF